MNSSKTLVRFTAFVCAMCDKSFNRTVSFPNGQPIPYECVRCPKCGAWQVDMKQEVSK